MQIFNSQIAVIMDALLQLTGTVSKESNQQQFKTESSSQTVHLFGPSRPSDLDESLPELDTMQTHIENRLFKQLRSISEMVADLETCGTVSGSKPGRKSEFSYSDYMKRFSTPVLATFSEDPKLSRTEE